MEFFRCSIHCLSLCSPQLHRDSAQYLRGISRNNGVCRYVFRHHATCADDCIFSDHYVGKNRRSGTDRRALLYYSLLDPPILLRLQLALGGRGARIGIVDEGDTVADECVVLNRHAFADECMTRNLAVLSHSGVLLNFDERANLRVFTDFAAVQIDELRKLYALTELYIGSDASVLAHSWMIFPFCLSDSSAASSIFTTCNPAAPSLNGVLLFKMQSTK